VNNKLIAIAAVAAVLTLGVGTAIATQPSSSSAQNNEPAVGATAPASEQNEAAEGQENETNGAAEGQDSDESLSGSPAQQAADAALRATGGGTVLEAEQGDDPRSTYEVEVRKNGGVIEVMLDSNFNVIGQTAGD
jgi:uncharacterized low-complexity protein